MSLSPIGFAPFDSAVSSALVLSFGLLAAHSFILGLSVAFVLFESFCCLPLPFSSSFSFPNFIIQCSLRSLWFNPFDLLQLPLISDSVAPGFSFPSSTLCYLYKEPMRLKPLATYRICKRTLVASPTECTRPSHR